MTVGQTGREKLKEVRSELGADTAEFVDTLFRRAPADFLERTPVKILAQIAREMLGLFRDHLAGGNPSSVRIANHSGDRASLTTILTCLSDRPFIVDSLAEFLRARGLREHVLLHPIIRTSDGQSLSVTYTEIDRIDRQVIDHQLSSDLENLVNHVCLVTDDFRPLLSRIEETARAVSRQQTNGKESFAKEVGDFLCWLADGGFVLLGSRVWSCSEDSLTVSDVDLGLFRTPDTELRTRLMETSRDALEIWRRKEIFQFAKVLVESPVHRRCMMDLVTVLIQGEKNSPAKIFGFLGMLTSKALSQEAASVPILRRKLTSILETDGLLPSSHDYKEVVSLVNSMPKSDLFQLDVETLQADLGVITDMQRRGSTRISVRTHSLHRFITVTVFLPRERYSSLNAERIKELLEERFSGGSTRASYHTVFVEESVVALYFLVPNPTLEIPTGAVDNLEQEIADLSLTWDDKLYSLLVQRQGRSTGHRLFSRYAESLPERYKASATPEQALKDVDVLESLSDEVPLEIDLRQVGSEEFDVVLFKRGGNIRLSSVIPFLENVGFEVESELVAPLVADGKSWSTIHSYRVRSRTGQITLPPDRLLLVGNVIRKLLQGVAENDPLNSLALEPGLSVQEIVVIRGLAQYLWQIKGAPSKGAIISSLVDNPSFAGILVESFRVKFDPALTGTIDDRVTKLTALSDAYLSQLKDVSLLEQDRILRSLLNIIDAAVRTNFFQDPNQLRVALKIECKKITKMPEPRPLFEIFVSSPVVEGIHLRGGKVARGGIRWSDRPDDFRTEVFGLLKTQMVKNAIIVPVGAKGGFVLKMKPEGKNHSRAQVEQGYRIFIRSLLELSDNRSQDQIVQPKNSVIWDEEDPYFVVAADKGTAQFSDVANDIAVREFQFWLGDAFASGGSLGYNHKKYGITARGAWETTCRHFREMGTDISTTSITAVGIGDMSGDVFGNGLLRSRMVKLVAAFDHRHIFIDPDPDPESSFIERERLFKLPTSSWTDYSAEKISQGGGVYPRDAKEITLSTEARQALGIDPSMLSGQELVRAILRAPVDLLWNGGIGTYVKASSEHNITVSDRANDEVRVDANELRTKIVGEGGNLGFTQLARIEFAQLGGRINTDAVDNSGGVNLSDLEVNFKILLRKSVEEGQISFDERNKILLNYADEACEMVCERNRSQSLAISLSTIRSRRGLGFCRGLIEFFEQETFLVRRSEFLPDDETFQRREQKKLGMFRPETAVLIAYAKMWIFDQLVASPIVDSSELEDFLLSYFPGGITDRFREAVLSHPLRREIIATQVANALVDRMGATFLSRTVAESGASDLSVIRAYTAATRILGGDELTSALKVLDTPRTSKGYLAALVRVASALDGMTRWLICRCQEDATIGHCVTKFKDGFQRLFAKAHLYVSPPELLKFEEIVQTCTADGLSESLARKIAGTRYAMVYLDTIDIAATLSCEIEDVAVLYSKLAAELSISKIWNLALKIDSLDHWDTAALRSLTSDLERATGLIVRAIIREKRSASLGAMGEYLGQRSEAVERYRASVRACEVRTPTVSTLVVISNELLALTSAGKEG